MNSYNYVSMAYLYKISNWPYYKKCIMAKIKWCKITWPFLICKIIVFECNVLLSYFTSTSFHNVFSALIQNYWLCIYIPSPAQTLNTCTHAHRHPHMELTQNQYNRENWIELKKQRCGSNKFLVYITLRLKNYFKC